MKRSRMWLTVWRLGPRDHAAFKALPIHSANLEGRTITKTIAHRLIRQATALTLS